MEPMGCMWIGGRFLLMFFVLLLAGISGYSQPCLAIDSPVVAHVFVLKNTGDTALRIFRIADNCSGKSCEIPKTETAPGKSLSLTVRFNTPDCSASPHSVSQTATIYLDDLAGRHRIILRARSVIRLNVGRPLLGHLRSHSERLP